MHHIRQGIGNIPRVCYNSGVKHVIISPGSRNAPLTIAFASYKKLKTISIVDERVAAFFALGIAYRTGNPVVIVCTSGSALLNFSPAIAEAYYQKISLLVFTADRPPEWIGQEDGQTIIQDNVYKNFIKKSFQFPVETVHDDDLHQANRILSEAILLSKSNCPGPVHVNIPLREPLYDPVPDFLDSSRFINSTFHPPMGPSNEELSVLQRSWANSTSIWIVAGMDFPDKEMEKTLAEIVQSKKALVFAENLSNATGDNFITSTERFAASLQQQEKELIRPTLLITIGGPVVSKRFKQYLREYKPLEHWLLSKYPKTVDTYQSLTKNVVGNPTDILKNLGSSGQDRNLHDKTLNIEKRALGQHETYLQSIDFSDLAVFDILCRNLPIGIILHLANSTPVRYAQLFPARPGVHYHSNRGVSGIEGPVSTSAGLAYGGQKEVFVITGDLAFIYDSNGMWNKQLPKNLKIIVVNNREGNIFRLIKTGPAIHGAMDYFTTPHEVDIPSLVKAFGLYFFSAGSRESLFEVLPEFLKPKDKPCVLEIQTSAEKSAEAFKKYFDHLKS